MRVSEHGASAHTGRAARPVAREGLCGGIARSRRLYRNPRFSNGLSNHKSSCFQLADPDVRTARSGAVPSSIGTPDLSSARSRVAILERCRTSSRPLRRTRSRAHSKTRMKNASQRRCAPRLVPDRRFSDWCVSPSPSLAIAPPRPARPSATPALTLARQSSLSVEPGVTRRHRRGRSDRSRPRRRRRARARAISSPPPRSRVARSAPSPSPGSPRGASPRTHPTKTIRGLSTRSKTTQTSFSSPRDTTSRPSARASGPSRSRTPSNRPSAPSSSPPWGRARRRSRLGRVPRRVRPRHHHDATKGCRVGCRVGCRGAANPARDARGGYRGCDDGEKRGDWSSGETRRRTRRRPANRAGTARGPGFGGGIDPHAAAHAVRMVMEVSGLDFGVGEGEASDAFVGDDMRVYV